MTKILEEVRAMSSEVIAKKQDAAKNKYPQLIDQIKKAAALGKTECEFVECEVDIYSKKLLEVEGFSVWATTKMPDNLIGYAAYDSKPKKIWVVRW